MRVEAQHLAKALIAALSSAVALERFEPGDDVAPGGVRELEHEHAAGGGGPERAHHSRALIPRALARKSPGGQEAAGATQGVAEVALAALVGIAAGRPQRSQQGHRNQPADASGAEPGAVEPGTEGAIEDRGA